MPSLAQHAGEVVLCARGSARRVAAQESVRALLFVRSHAEARTHTMTTVLRGNCASKTKVGMHGRPCRQGRHACRQGPRRCLLLARGRRRQTRMPGLGHLSWEVLREVCVCFHMDMGLWETERSVTIVLSFGSLCVLPRLLRCRASYYDVADSGTHDM